jgi:hypothetical protein
MYPEKNNGNWQKALELANCAKRCGSKTRSGNTCKSPAMPNGRCRIHGGKSPGAPHGEAHGRYRHGKCTIEAKEKERENREVVRLFKSYFSM